MESLKKLKNKIHLIEKASNWKTLENLNSEHRVHTYAQIRSKNSLYSLERDIVQLSHKRIIPGDTPKSVSVSLKSSRNIFSNQKYPSLLKSTIMED